MDTHLLISFVVAMVAIVNPVGKIPLWLEASGDEEGPVRRRLAFLVVTIATIVLLLALVFGQGALEFFGIDIPSFKIGGGLVVLYIGFRMLNGRAVEIGGSDSNREDPAMERAKQRLGDVFVPLVIPILAGPGSLTTAILYGSRADSYLVTGVLAGILVVVMVLVFGILLLARRIRALVGDLALQVFTRIFGLILIALAVQMIVEGVAELFPALLGPGSPLHNDLNESRPAG